jgi:hypothetical protein
MVLFEDEPPTKVSIEQKCYKVRAYCGVSKHGMAPWMVTIASNGIKAKSKGVNGEEYLTLLQEHMVAPCEDLMA